MTKVEILVVPDEPMNVHALATLAGTSPVAGSGLRDHREPVRPDMSLDDARDLAVRAVVAAIERDTGSGNGVVVATITVEGVEIEDFDEVDAALTA